MSERIIVKGNTKLLKPVITELMALYQLIDSKDLGTIYAYTDDKQSVKRVGKPKVCLFFLEDTSYKKQSPVKNKLEGDRRQKGLIRFRLMDESTQTISKSNATTLARKIKDVFGVNGGFVWKKGKTMYTYNHWELGYQFQLLCRSATEAKRIVSATLSLQNHIPDWKNFNTVKNDEELVKYPEEPGKQLVMGESLDIPQHRPLVDVRFQYAYIRLDDVIQPINLYDRRNKLVNTLVS